MSLKCPNPECGQKNYFHITCKVTCEVDSERSRIHPMDELMFDEANHCVCPECEHDGSVGEFTTTEGDPE